MLYEDDIVDAVCDHLKSHNFTIVRKCTAKQHGDDIVATGAGKIRELYIEAKGETSSRHGSNRYGKPFHGFQIQDHVANAFFRAAKMAVNGRVGGIALPKNAAHEQCVTSIQHAIDALGIIVFWVAPDRRVTTSVPLDRGPSVTCLDNKGYQLDGDTHFQHGAARAAEIAARDIAQWFVPIGAEGLLPGAKNRDQSVLGQIGLMFLGIGSHQVNPDVRNPSFSRKR
jgi:hypothetical protein